MRTRRYSHMAYRGNRRGRKSRRWRRTPGVASDFIHHLSAMPPNKRKRVVLYCRVSTDKQEQLGNLDEEEADAILRLRRLGIRPGHRLVAVFSGVESGRIGDDRPLLERAIAEARKRKAVLVAPYRDRLIRSARFNGSNETETPSVGEYMRLRSMAGDVPLATLLDPNKAARSEQIKRGQAAKNNRGGRPVKSEQRALLEAVWSKWKTIPR